MKTLAVLSFFRNSARNGQIRRYMRQVHGLRADLAGRYDVRLIAVWGDCKDGTEVVLWDEAELTGVPIQIAAHHHGGPIYGSTEELDRMHALSRMGNFGLSLVRPTDDLVWYVESDLIWRPAIVERLLAQVDTTARAFDVLAPMTFAGDAFYDIWGFRLGTNPDGSDRRFSPFHPFHPDLKFDGPTAVDSVGSALLMRGVVARSARMTPDGPRYALVSFCHNARAQGYRVGTDARLKIHHP